MDFDYTSLPYKPSTKLFYGKFKFKIRIPIASSEPKWGFPPNRVQYPGVSFKTAKQLTNKTKFQVKAKEIKVLSYFSSITFYFNDISFLDFIFADDDVVKHRDITLFSYPDIEISADELISNAPYDYRAHLNRSRDHWYNRSELYLWMRRQADVDFYPRSGFCYINSNKLTLMQLAYPGSIRKLERIVKK